MILQEDTICAISTASGTGALAVVRISGPDAIRISDHCLDFKNEKKKLAEQAANTLHFARFKQKEQIIDEVVIGLFKSPRSYTGEDLVEISCHGSSYIQQKILEILIQQGARMAKPGEFTQRAFLNGKLDLSQAEAVADLIATESEAAHRLAINQMRGGFSTEIIKLRDELLHFISMIELELDFSEEDVEFANREQLAQLIHRVNSILTPLVESFKFGNAIKNGIPVAIIGPTNAGKSTLLNRLLREEKAIVSEIAGTTRDYIEDTIVLEGVQFRFIDTAGLRHTSDKIESEGIQRTRMKYEQASVVIVLIDPAESMEQIEQSLALVDKDNALQENKTIILALNKTDLYNENHTRAILDQLSQKFTTIDHFLGLSAKDGQGIKELEKILVNDALSSNTSTRNVVVTNIRHYEALQHASEALERANVALITGLPSDLLAQDIREVLHYLGEITGEITTDEILGNIFKNFCIGK